jgi:hypothetical protein
MSTPPAWKNPISLSRRMIRKCVAVAEAHPSAMAAFAEAARADAGF